MRVTVKYVTVPTTGVTKGKNTNVQNAAKELAVRIPLNAAVILASANIPFAATVGINTSAVIRFVQNAITSWVTQNPNICDIIFE